MPERASFLTSERPLDPVACTRCRETYDAMELDRLLWCERCRIVTRHRAAWWGWLIGIVFAAGVAAYVWLVIRPTDLVIGGWIATVVAAAWIGSKVGREIMYGVFRARTRRADEDAPRQP